MTSKKARAGVKRRESENTATLLRRFSRKAQQSGVIVEAKSGRYRSRPKSDLRKKNEALARIKKRKKIEKLKKLGKIK